MTRDALLPIIWKPNWTTLESIGATQNAGVETEVQVPEDVRLVHPTVDILEDILVLGFSTLHVGEDGLEPRPLFIVDDGGRFQIETSAEKLTLDGTEYYAHPGILPPRLAGRWSADGIRAFLEAPAAPNNLFEDVKQIFERHLEASDPAHFGLLAGWTVMTFLHPIFSAVPFLHLRGPKQSAKSQALDIISQVALNSWRMEKVTEAALGRVCMSERATVLIDQAERLPADLIGLLAGSYKRGGGRRVISASGIAGNSVVAFDLYGPKAFAGTKDLPKDLADRCITLKTVRSLKEFDVLQLDDPAFAAIRDASYRFLLTRWREVRATYRKIREPGRVGELWRPLQAVLQVLEVPENEVAEIRRAFDDGVGENRAYLESAEEALFQALVERSRQEEQFETTPTELRQAMMTLLPDEKVPSGRWIGGCIRRFNLGRKMGKRSRTKRNYYQFSAAQVLDLARRYTRTLV